MYNFDVWEYSLENLKQSTRERAKALIKKYGLPINENALDKTDWYEYEAVKDYIKSLEAAQAPTPITRKEEELEKNISYSIYYPIQKTHEFGEKIGEFAADALIAKYYKDTMDNVGKFLTDTYGKNIGAGDGIDNYYHPMLQCQLAKISPQSRKNGILLGNAKENFDYIAKTLKGMSEKEVLEDSFKDLLNNAYGSKLGQKYPNKSCYDLLDHLRTKNMRRKNIR